MNSVFKKVISLVVALAIIFSTSFILGDVFAKESEEGSITVNNAVNGKTYGIYRIFDLTHSNDKDNKAVSYTINADWKDFFTKGEGRDYIIATNTNNLNPIIVDGETKYINITNDNVAEFAKAAMDEIKTKDRVKTAKAENDKAEFSRLPLGYYLVHPEGATEKKEGQDSIVSLTSTVPHGEVNSKGQYPTIKKEATEKSADIGGEVEFKLTSKVPDITGYSAYNFDVTDTLSQGLDYVRGSLKVEVKDSNNVLNYLANYNNKILTISFTKTNLESLKTDINKELIITYKAKINKDAVIGNGGNENKVFLEYSNDPKDNTKKEKTPESKVKVYTGKITVTKIDAKNINKKLSGAEFVLKNSEGKFYKQALDKSDKKVEKVEWVDSVDNATKLTTGEDGVVAFEGLKAGTYHLKEIKAPEGYNILTSDTEFTLSDNDTSDQSLKMVAESKIENSSGVKLPKTGGRGRRLFALIGGIVILCTASSLVRGKVKSERR